jgi:cytoskeletal protein RodZ
MSLEALERSDLSRLPGGIFTRAFVRAYAQEVGLDADRTVQDFIAELPAEAATATAHATSIEDGEKLESDRRAAATLLRLVLVGLPIIVLILYYGARGVPAPVERSAEPPPAFPAALHGAPASPASGAELVDTSPAAAASPAAVTLHETGLSMEIAPRATCWVSVNTDGEQVFSGVMNAGDRRLVTAKEQIALNVGDAGAFAYTLNGREGKSLGAPGKMVSARITLANHREFLAP